jgi:hypothetical protein
METINLKEALIAKIPTDCYWEEMENLTNCPIEHVTEAIKEIIKQVLELAAENATLTKTSNWKGGSFGVDKQSILDTIKQIE